MRYKFNLIVIFLVSVMFVDCKFSVALDNFYLSANRIEKNDKNNTITAYENVNITSGKYKLKADKIIYYLKKKRNFSKR